MNNIQLYTYGVLLSGIIRLFYILYYLKYQNNKEKRKLICKNKNEKENYFYI